jgi:hypothetical protein
VSFAASGNCSIAVSALHIIGAGSCTITASQAGDSNYNSAADVPQSLTINKAAPLVTVSCPGAGFDNNPHACTAAVTGIGSVTVSGTTTITYNSNPATPNNAGTYSVSAIFISSDSNYADTTASGSLIITRASQTITFAALAAKIFGDTDFAVGATASSGLAVGFTATGNCSVAGSTVHITGAGSCTITVAQAGDANFNAAVDVPQSFSISKASQTITFGSLAGKIFGAADFTVSASASSSLTVAFSANGNCSVTGSVVHLTSPGACTVTAAQAGNANFNPAASVSQSFLIIAGDDFAIVPTLPSVTVVAGQSATQHIAITPSPATVTALSFSCSGLPAKTSCSFSPNPVLPGLFPTDVVMTITTTASTTAALERPRTLYAGWLAFTSMGLVGVVLMGGYRKGRKKVGTVSAMALMMVLLAVGCGGRSVQPPVTILGTPQGTSTITVTGSTSGFTHSTTFMLVVK